MNVHQNKCVRDSIELCDELKRSNANWLEAADTGLLSPPKLTLESCHPTIKEPLVLWLSEGFPVSWYADVARKGISAFDSSPQHCLEFLNAFLDERLLHAVAYTNDVIVAVGIITSNEWTRWHLNFDRIELRSWRGTFDADILLDQSADPRGQTA